MSDIKRNCIACKNELQEGKCDVCHSEQDAILCTTCKLAMPAKAKRCNLCSTYRKRWRKRIQLLSVQATWLSGLFAIISTGFAAVSYFNAQNSNTTFKVTGTGVQNLVNLQVWNFGPKPSTIVGCRLLLGGRSDKEVAFDISNLNQPSSTTLVSPGPPVRVDMSRALNSMLPEARRKRQYTTVELRQLFCDGTCLDQTVTMQLDVEESSDPWSPWNLFRPCHTRTDTFPARRISEQIKTWGLDAPGR